MFPARLGVREKGRELNPLQSSGIFSMGKEKEIKSLAWALRAGRERIFYINWVDIFAC